MLYDPADPIENHDPRPPHAPASAGDDERLEIHLPDPCLVVLCGPSGAGKSTFARTHFPATQIVSSDRCRALVSDTEDFGPDSSGRAFRLLHETIRHRMALRRLTVADTTALERASRAQFLEVAREFDVPTVLLVFAVDETECGRRNRLRNRDVGNRVIARQFRLVRTALLSVASEAFDQVHILTDAMMQRLAIRLESEPESKTNSTAATAGTEGNQKAETASGPGAANARRGEETPRPFPGWADPRDSDAEETPIPFQYDKEVYAHLREGTAALGTLEVARRREARALLTASNVDPRFLLFRPAPPEPPDAEWPWTREDPRAKTEAESPKGEPGVSADSPLDEFAAFCRALASHGFRRVCLEAWPERAERVGLLVVREPERAIRPFGAAGWGALWNDEAQGLFEGTHGPGEWFETLARDLDNAAFFSRYKTPVLVAQALAVWTRDPIPYPPRKTPHPAPEFEGVQSHSFSTNRPQPLDGAWARREDDPEDLLAPEYFEEFAASVSLGFRPRRLDPTRLRLWITDLLHPAEPEDPAHPEFLWRTAEAADLAESFGHAPRIVLDLEADNPWEDLNTVWWWDRWRRRPGWRLVVARATKYLRNNKYLGYAPEQIHASVSPAHAPDERPDIGFTGPPRWVFSGRDDADTAPALWECRRRGIEEIAKALAGSSALRSAVPSATGFAPWHSWAFAAWSHPPHSPTTPQPDLFEE